MRRFSYALIGAIVITLATYPAAAQTMCGDHQEIVKQLDKEFAENRIGFGLDASGRLMELFASPETGGWTLLLTLPNGLACLVGAGDIWETVPVPAPLGPVV